MFRLIFLLFRVGASISGANAGAGGTRETVTGTRAKMVKCEKCQYDFVYTVTRSATGPVSSSTGKAYETVGHRLDVVLENAIESVPCPACGWTQSYMLPIAKASQAKWMNVAGGVALAITMIAALLGLPALTDHTNPIATAALILSALMLFTAIGFFVMRAVIVSRFDPNTISPEVQKALGQRQSVAREDYEKSQGEIREKKLDRREQAKRNMASGYCLTSPLDELTACRYCGYRQEAKNKQCVSCKRALDAVS